MGGLLIFSMLIISQLIISLLVNSLLIFSLLVFFIMLVFIMLVFIVLIFCPHSQESMAEFMKMMASGNIPPEMMSAMGMGGGADEMKMLQQVQPCVTWNSNSTQHTTLVVLYELVS